MSTSKHGPRRKIWQLPPQYHCSLIGTCLSLDDLHRLARRSELRLEEPADDYALHRAFVELADRPLRPVRLLQALLDRRHRTALKRYAELADARARIHYWEAACAGGEIAAAYWALMTSAATEMALRIRAHGEVHMLSHLAGASRRRELREITRLRERATGLGDQLASARAQVRQQQEIIQALNRRLALAHVAEAEAERLQHRCRVLESGEALTRARQHERQLAAEVERLRHRCRRLEREAHALRRERAKACHALAEERNERQALEGENSSLEALVRQLTEPCDGQCQPDCPRFDLCRRRILYVGGRNNLAPHLRRLVEQANGEFVHHDGGREQSAAHLAALLPAADAVVCPADCISHGALDLVRQICQQQAKPLLTLRRASLSAFAEGLRQLADQWSARPLLPH